MHMWPNGKTFYCCVSDSNSPIGNVNESSLKELWNSEKMRLARKKFLNNETLPDCKRCQSLEKNAKLKTLRTQANFDYGENHWSVVESTQEDGRVDQLNLPYLDFRFSNLCNLRCRSCGPELSSSWLKDEKTLIGRKRFPNVIQPDNLEKIWEELLPHLDKVESVNFAGGEPLIEEYHYKLLNHWISISYSPKTICYTTNFSVFQFKKWNVLNLWKHFPKILLVASLDATGSRAEYMRKGTQWKQILENRKLLEKECPHVRFEISPTVSIYNVWHLPDFLSEWITAGLLGPEKIRINMLTFPNFMDVRNLPETFIAEVIAKYERVLQQLETTIPMKDSKKEALRNSFYAVIHFLNSAHEIPQAEKAVNLQKFLDHTKILDVLREEDFCSTYPELAFLMNSGPQKHKWEQLW